MPEYLTYDQLRERLREEIKKRRSLAEYARELEVYDSFLGAVVWGHRLPGTKICRALGVREVKMYEVMGSDESTAGGQKESPEPESNREVGDDTLPSGQPEAQDPLR